LPAQTPTVTRRKVETAVVTPVAPAPDPAEAPWPDPQTPGHPADVVHHYAHISDDESSLALLPWVGRFRQGWVSRGDGSTQRDESQGCSGSYTVKGDELHLQADTFEIEDNSYPSNQKHTLHRRNFRQTS
jgi:hypothetical protein